MTFALPPIVLNTHWRFSLDDSGSLWQALPRLADWPQQRLSSAGALRLRRVVSLSPAGFCVRYLLVIASAPENTVVYVNGWRVGITHPDVHFQANVTDQVALEDNLIEFEVCRSGSFGDVVLQALPCPPA